VSMNETFVIAQPERCEHIRTNAFGVLRAYLQQNAVIDNFRQLLQRLGAAIATGTGDGQMRDGAIVDYLVVGSGLFGAVFSQQAKEAGRSVRLIEKRDHIGGNCFSYEFDDTNITVHAYGTHIFHTSDPDIWNYVNRFTEFNRYSIAC